MYYETAEESFAADLVAIEDLNTIERALAVAHRAYRDGWIDEDMSKTIASALDALAVYSSFSLRD
jgi:hypothetical protein